MLSKAKLVRMIPKNHKNINNNNIIDCTLIILFMISYT